MYPGFDVVAMESEICHTFSFDNGHVSPCMFLTAMAPIVWRDPAIFMQAAAMVCQIETIGGTSHHDICQGEGKGGGQEQGQGQRKG